MNPFVSVQHIFDHWIGDPAPKSTKVHLRSVLASLGWFLCFAFPAGAATYNWNAAPDTFQPSEIDLRHRNETVAGEHGWVTQANGNFYRGDGQLLRFWGVTGATQSTLEKHREMARFMAKHGINLQRFHTSLYDNGAAQLSDVHEGRLDSLFRLVTANKAEGIYTEISYFFILGLRMQARWGIDGYTEEWIQANLGDPDQSDDGLAEQAPFGLMFFDEKFQEAFKNWLTIILTTPNPYDPEKKALKDEPAIAMIELQNEDNLFFWTWDPARFPLPQQQKIYRAFGDYLIAKYGSLNAAQSAWGGPTSRSGDNFAQGLVAVGNAGSMTGTGNNSASSKRTADQIAFFIERTNQFYAALKQHCRELGYGGTFGASNWRTADDKNLQDVEWYTYTTAGVIDTHNYFDAYYYSGTRSPGPGDTYYSMPVVENPRRAPFATKTVENHPFIVSETAWVNPSDHAAEAAVLTAAFCSLRSIDAWIWFAYAQTGWSQEYETWPVGTPSLMGQFPAAALIYRRGDLATASTLVREGKSPASLHDRQPNIIRTTFGWDPARDPETTFTWNPETLKGDVDSAAMLVGNVELAFDTDQDFVSDQLPTLIDNDNKTITSATGQLKIDYARQFASLDSPRAQGAIGNLKSRSTTLTDVVVAGGATFTFGSVTVVSLEDDKPINQATKLLLVAGMQDRLTGHATEPFAVPGGLPGRKLLQVGTPPWQVDEVDVRITLRNRLAAEVVSVQGLNENGYASGPKLAASAINSGQDTRFSLPKNLPYTLVTLKAPGDPAPVIQTVNLPNARTGEDYEARLEALGGNAPLVWSVAGDSSLPAGLFLSEDGILSGIPRIGATHAFTLQVADADGDVDSHDFFLISLPYGTTSIFGTTAATVRLNDNFAWNEKLGYLYDGFYPYLFLYGYANWLYLFASPGDTEKSGFYLYDFQRNEFGYTNSDWYPYMILVTGPNKDQFIDLSQPSS